MIHRFIRPTHVSLTTASSSLLSRASDRAQALGACALSPSAHHLTFRFFSVLSRHSGKYRRRIRPKPLDYDQTVLNAVPQMTELLEPHRKLLSAFGLGTAQCGHLIVYLAHLWASNPKHNLFSRRLTAAQLLDNHVLDSLLATPHFPAAVRVVADLGSGAGLPALPLSLAFPDRRFVLFETSPTKQEFLSDLCRLRDPILDQLIFPNVAVAPIRETDAYSVHFPRRGEDSTPPPSADRTHRYLADMVMSRAFKPIPDTLRLTAEFFAEGGNYMFYKGRLAKIEQELAQAATACQRTLPSLPHRLQRLAPVAAGVEERYLVFMGPCVEDTRTTSIRSSSSSGTSTSGSGSGSGSGVRVAPLGSAVGSRSNGRASAALMAARAPTSTKTQAAPSKPQLQSQPAPIAMAMVSPSRVK